MTPSQARNAIKKSLKALVDPKPKQRDKDAIWKFFGFRCAYCGVQLTKESRKGHIDHLYSEMDGGSNKLCNLVLTCSTCNGDEKRESNWKEFLNDKCGNDAQRCTERESKINNWVNMNGSDPLLPKQTLSRIESEFERINKVFSDSIEKLRNNEM